MGNTLFASNNPAHWLGSQVGTLVNSFDTSKVPYSIQLGGGQSSGSPNFTPSTTGVTWFHFSVFSNGASSTGALPSGSNGVFFECYDSSNFAMLSLTKRLSAFLEYSITLRNKSISTVFNVTTPVNAGFITVFDISLEITQSLIRANVYMNNSLVGTVTFTSNPNTVLPPNRFTISGALGTNIVGTGSVYYSEIFVSDDSTRNARMSFLPIDGSGYLTQWDGLLSSLIDSDGTTGINTNVPNERHMMTIGTYAGKPSASTIVLVSTTTRGINSPTKLRHVLRSGGVNYDSADISIPFDYQYNITESSLNPATNNPWTTAEIEALEIGLLSVA